MHHGDVDLKLQGAACTYKHSFISSDHAACFSFLFYSPGVDNATLATKGLDLDHTPLSEGIIVWLYARKSALAPDDFACGHSILIGFENHY